jgi:hypothetical protein
VAAPAKTLEAPVAPVAPPPLPQTFAPAAITPPAPPPVVAPPAATSGAAPPPPPPPPPPQTVAPSFVEATSTSNTKVINFLFFLFMIKILFHGIPDNF